MGVYDIRHLPRTAKKGQVLAGFLVEIQSVTLALEEVLCTKEEMQTEILSIDGASNVSGSGIGIVLKAPLGLRIKEALRLDFHATKNKAEYEALLHGLELAK